jgi:hypothetical protein
MRDIAVVTIRESLGKLSHDSDGFDRVEPAASVQVQIERLSLDQLHHQPQATLWQVAVASQLYERGVIQPEQRFDLVLLACRQARLKARRVPLEDLDGNRVAAATMRPVNGPEPALAQNVGDDEFTDGATGRKPIGSGQTVLLTI